jgi:hypothetical protein
VRPHDVLAGYIGGEVGTRRGRGDRGSGYMGRGVQREWVQREWVQRSTSVLVYGGDDSSHHRSRRGDSR